MNDACTQTDSTSHMVRLYVQPNSAPVMIARIYERVHRSRVFVSLRPLTKCLAKDGSCEPIRFIALGNFKPWDMFVFGEWMGAVPDGIDKSALNTLFVDGQKVVRLLQKFKAELPDFIRTFILDQIKQAFAAVRVRDEGRCYSGVPGICPQTLHVGTQTELCNDESYSLVVPLTEAEAGDRRSSSVPSLRTAPSEVVPDWRESPKVLSLMRSYRFVAAYLPQSVVESDEFAKLCQRMNLILSVLAFESTAAFNEEVYVFQLRLMAIWNEGVMVTMRRRIERYKELTKAPNREAAMTDRLLVAVRDYNVLLQANRQIKAEIATITKKPLLCDSVMVQL